MILQQIRPRLPLQSIPEQIHRPTTKLLVSLDHREGRYAATLGRRTNLDLPTRGHLGSRPSRRRLGPSLFGLLIVVRHQTPPDKFLVCTPRLNHSLSITVARSIVFSYEFFPVTRAHVLTKAARTTK